MLRFVGNYVVRVYIPFLNDPNVWFLTLDENGCWNGNCDPYIAINGDTTTQVKDLVFEKEKRIEIYPNPTNGIFTLESSTVSNNRKRIVEVTNLAGKLVSKQKLYAPKSIINLSHLDSGIYFITEVIDGVKQRSEKIIVAPH